VGGDLVFYGARDEPRQTPLNVPLLEVGHAVLYRGTNLHRWKPLEPLGVDLRDDSPSFSRTVLNISGRSSTWRAEYMAVDDEYPIRVSSHMDL